MPCERFSYVRWLTFSISRTCRSLYHRLRDGAYPNARPGNLISFPVPENASMFFLSSLPSAFHSVKWALRRVGAAGPNVYAAQTSDELALGWIYVCFMLITFQLNKEKGSEGNWFIFCRAWKSKILSSSPLMRKILPTYDIKISRSNYPLGEYKNWN